MEAFILLSGMVNTISSIEGEKSEQLRWNWRDAVDETWNDFSAYLFVAVTSFRKKP